MSDIPIFQFVSHIAGKNAKVSIYPDRIEWQRKGVMSTGAKAAVGFMTFGASLAATGLRGRSDSDLIMIQSITSVSTQKSGLAQYLVNVRTPAGEIGFRCSKSEAQQVKDILLRLMSQSVGGAPQAPMPQPVLQAPAAPAPAPVDPQPDIMAQLTQLGELRDSGILTDEEFNAKKAELLRRL